MISPLGADKATSFANALAGKSAVGPASTKITERLPHTLVAAATDPEPLLDKKYAGLDRATQFALLAAQEAMADAKIESSPDDAQRFGVFVGIGFGGAQTVDSQYSRFYGTLHDPAQSHKNPTVIHPLSVPRMMANASAAMVSMRYGLRGISNTYSVACASSAVAAGEALRAIRHGYLDAAIVIGTESMLTPGSMIAWNALRVLAKPDPVDPARSCKPFSQGRSGFVLGEGAAAIVLENEARARRRSASIYGELCGYGASSDADHLTVPAISGQVAAMQQALTEANLPPSAIGYVNAHGTATDAGDVVETQSLREVFGQAADRLPVSSTKAVHGHLIGAGGVLEFALSVMAMNSGSIPPTAHLDTPDARCNLDYVPEYARHGSPLDAVMSNSFAFGGSNAVLIARRYSC